MFKSMFRRTTPVTPPTFEVQLHRIEGDRVVYSWEPIRVAGLGEAQQQARDLRQCNRWGDSTGMPMVTIKDEHGEFYPESAYWPDAINRIVSA